MSRLLSPSLLTLKAPSLPSVVVDSASDLALFSAELLLSSELGAGLFILFMELVRRWYGGGGGPGSPVDLLSSPAKGGAHGKALLSSSELVPWSFDRRGSGVMAFLVVAGRG